MSVTAAKKRSAAADAADPAALPANLAEEIGKRDGFAMAEEEAHLNILRTAAGIEEPFERLFRDHGLSPPLYNVLRIVRGMTTERGSEGVPAGEIGPQMITPSPDVTRLVDRVEKLGLVTRRRSEADRRVVLVKLTPKGARLLKKLDPRMHQLLRESLAHLSRAELRTINELMHKTRHGPLAE
ncbi:MAG: MarR family transcriptional regulator [Planctomycetota bacterium]